MSTAYDDRIKIALMGPSNAGKSCMVNQLVRSEFRVVRNTLGLEVSQFDHNQRKLFIWDSSGFNRFQFYVPKLLEKAKAVIVMFDITSQSMFNQLNDYVETLKDITIPIILVGNKTDLQHRRCIKKVDAENFASDNGWLYTEISATNRETIINMIDMLLSHIKYPEDNANATSEWDLATVTTRLTNFANLLGIT